MSNWICAVCKKSYYDNGTQYGVKAYLTREWKEIGATCEYCFEPTTKNKRNK